MAKRSASSSGVTPVAVHADEHAVQDGAPDYDVARRRDVALEWYESEKTYVDGLRAVDEVRGAC